MCSGGINQVTTKHCSKSCNMQRIANWKGIVSKFKNKLYSWKAPSLPLLEIDWLWLNRFLEIYLSITCPFIGCSLLWKKLWSLRNNFFIGGDLEDKKMTWVAWKMCLASRDLGALGIVSIFSLNRSLLFEWIWTFRMHPNDL